jgi:hypothetical protein
MRVLALVIPTASNARSGGGADQRNGLGDNVQAFGTFAGDSNFCFCAKLYV